MFPKKSLGQNFLKSLRTAELLIRAASIKNADVIVEVGPGEGVITELLLKKAAKIIAVEKDTRMISFLTEKFTEDVSRKKLILVHDDILFFNPSAYCLEPKAYKLIGSIPYYITGAFLRKFLTKQNQPESMALIIQKEVAERIIAKDGKESILSVSVKAYGAPTYVQTISRDEFFPVPNVDSAIMVIENISRKFFSDISEDAFFALVKAGFSSKRKKVISNIKKQFPHINWEKIFTDSHISLDARAEDFTLEHWRLLTKKAEYS